MRERIPNPQINVSKIPAGGGIAGAMFAIISMIIFLIGIPALRYFLVGAIVLGGIVAVAIHFRRHDTPGRAWLLASKEDDDSGDETRPATSHRSLIPSASLS